MKKLHKVLTNHSGTNQSELAEIVAAATSYTEMELLAAQLRVGGEGSHRTRQRLAAGVLFKASGQLRH